MFPNDSVSALTLTAASANGNSADLDNRFYRGVQLAVNISAISGTSATLTVIVEGYDPASASYYTLLTSAGLTATGLTVLTIYPGVTVAANVAVSNALARTWRVRYTITGTTPSVTATVGANLIL